MILVGELKCRCGCQPIAGLGSKDGVWVTLIVCRTPEAHAADEKTMAVGIDRSPTGAESEALRLWTLVNSGAGSAVEGLAIAGGRSN